MAPKFDLKTVDSHGKDIETLKEGQKRNDLIMIGIVVVLFVGIAASFIATGALIVDYLAERKAIFEDLKDQVVKQNANIEVLTNEIRNSRSDNTQEIIPSNGELKEFKDCLKRSSGYWPCVQN